MFNASVNRILLAITKWQMRKYLTFPSASTAVILVNPQNAFLENDNALLAKLLQILSAAEQFNFPVIYTRYHSDSSNPYPSPGQLRLQRLLSASQKGDDILSQLAPKEGCQVFEINNKLSAFAGSALDEYLKEHQIERVVLAGPMANITLDSTARDAVELGYHTTILSDCTSAHTPEELHLTVKVTFPRFAQSVMSLAEFRQIADRTYQQIP